MLHPHFNGRPILVGDQVKVVNLEDENTSYPYPETVSSIHSDYHVSPGSPGREEFGYFTVGYGDPIFTSQADAERFGLGWSREDVGYVAEHTPQEAS